MTPAEPKHAAEETATKLAIRIFELKQLNEDLQSPDIVERIKLKRTAIK